MNEHKKRAKAMCRTIRIAWSSLKSHLQYAVDPNGDDPNSDVVFHAQAIIEYSQQIVICAKELKHINTERKAAGSDHENKRQNNCCLHIQVC